MPSSLLMIIILPLFVGFAWIYLLMVVVAVVVVSDFSKLSVLMDFSFFFVTLCL